MLCKGREKRTNTEDVLSLLEDIADHKQEHFVVLTFDSKQELITKRIVFIGTVNSVIAHPREVFAGALEDRAVSIIVAHNHPSGDPEPSEADMAMTEQLAAAGRVLDIKLHDHIVVAGNKYLSLKEKGVVVV